MKRIRIICEGQTEQEFVNKMLTPAFSRKQIFFHPSLIRASRGGIIRWELLKKEIEIHLKVDKEAYVTTFIDYYGVYKKHEFPQWDSAHEIPDKNERMDCPEQAMRENIDPDFRHRFIPYFQLHEFEALLFCDMDVFHKQISPTDLIGKKELKEIFNRYSNPEMINNNKTTSPSHRLESIIKGYNKVVYGNIIAEAIGLECIRTKAPRFDAWLNRMEDS